jgi:hypothetical protein
MSTYLELRRGVVQESQFGWRARCRVCGALPSRWRVANDLGWDYFCEQHEANKDMCAAAPLSYDTSRRD